MKKGSVWLSSIVLGASIFGLDAQAYDSCRRLGPGESQVINTDWKDSPTSLSARYRLSRSGSSFLAEVSIEFIYDESSQSGREVQAEYLRKTNACLEQAKPFLKGPNGETLRIVAVDPDANPSLPKNIVHLHSGQGREDSQNWSANIPCTIVVHETLHLLGLPDVYPERKLVLTRGGYTQGSGNTAYDCRSIGPSDSVMFNDFRKFEFLPTQYIRYDACVCSRGAEARCQEVLERGSLESHRQCPAGFFPLTLSGQVSQGELPKGIRGTPSFALRDSIEVLRTEAPTRKSLLYPAEFRVITEPGCADSNGLYYACAANAYRTSSGRGGQGCLHVPSACRSPDFSWLQ